VAGIPLPLLVVVQAACAQNAAPAKDSVPVEARQPVPWVGRAKIEDPGNFYTKRSFCVCIHGVGLNSPEHRERFPVDDPETLDFLASFDHIRNSNYYPLPRNWIDYLHAHQGIHRRLLYYQQFQHLRFVAGKDRPQPFEAWKTRFLDDHRGDHFTINPLIPPDKEEYALGFWGRAPYITHKGLRDYFYNYGNGRMDDFLVRHYIDEKLADWDYDGLYFDLTGSSFTRGGRIQSATDPEVLLSALEVYNTLAHTRDDPTKSYDQNAVAFLRKLRARSPDPAGFPIWSNQAYKCGDKATGANEYYKVVTLDQIESVFTSWRNMRGWKRGVRVKVDGVWHEDAIPVETEIIPFFKGMRRLEPVLRQIEYARANYENHTEAITLNFVRPRYEPFEDGYVAVVDREAIYYGYLGALVAGIHAYGWDYFDTYVNYTGSDRARSRVPDLPRETGLPRHGHFKWAKDPVYFLDLGDPVEEGYQTMTMAEGRTAVVRFFEKGFIAVNASDPAQDIVVDLSGSESLKDLSAGAVGYYDHFARAYLPSDTRYFKVPAAYYPLADKLTNSARVYSYVDERGRLID
jgi:hypothetical protein